MLYECKCVMCKHFVFDFSFEHKCEAYPNEMPDSVFKDNSDNKDCHSDICNFEYKQNEDKPLTKEF